MSISPEQNLRFNQIVEKKVKSACPTILSESDCSKRAPMWDSVQEAILKCWGEEFPEIYTVPELPEKLTRRYQKFTEQCLSPSEIGLNERSCSVSQRAVTESDRTQELLSVISAIVGRLRIKLSSLPIPQGEIVLVEKFFLRDEKNYKSLDWFLLRSEGEIKKTVSEISSRNWDFSISSMKEAVASGSTVDQFFMGRRPQPATLCSSSEDWLRKSGDVGADPMRQFLDAIESELKNFADHFCGDGKLSRDEEQTYIRDRSYAIQSLCDKHVRSVPKEQQPLYEYQLSKLREYVQVIFQFVSTLVDKYPQEEVSGDSVVSNRSAEIRKVLLFNKNLIGDVLKRVAQYRINQDTVQYDTKALSDWCEFFSRAPASIKPQEFGEVYSSYRCLCNRWSCAFSQIFSKYLESDLSEATENFKKDIQRIREENKQLPIDESLEFLVGIVTRRLELLKRLADGVSSGLSGRSQEFCHFCSKIPVSKLLKISDPHLLEDLDVQLTKKVVSTELLDLMLEGLPMDVKFNTHVFQGYKRCTGLLSAKGYSPKKVMELGYRVWDSSNWDLASFDWLLRGPEENLLKFVRLIERIEKPVSIKSFRHFMENGGAVDEFFSLMDSFLVSTEIHPQFLTKEWGSLMTVLNPYQKKILAKKINFSRLASIGCPATWVRGVTSNPQAFELFVRLARSSLVGDAFRRVFTILMTPDLSSHDALSINEYRSAIENTSRKNGLTSDQRLQLLRHLKPEELSPIEYYFLEEHGVVNEFLQKSTILKNVPVELLIRFLTGMPFSQACSWLQSHCKSDTGKEIRRADTLSEEQKITILRRFRSFDGLYPRKELLSLFGLSQEMGGKLCVLPQMPIDPNSEEWNNRLQGIIDPLDPTSLFFEVGTSISLGKKFWKMLVLQLLHKAKEVSLCGNRMVLTWGNVNPVHSLCCDSDNGSLLGRVAERPVSIHMSGLLGDFQSSIAAVTMRRQLLEQIRPIFPSKPKHWLEYIEANDPVMSYEIERIAQSLKRRYPHLEQTISDLLALAEGDSDEEQGAASGFEEISEDGISPSSPVGERAAPSAPRGTETLRDIPKVELSDASIVAERVKDLHELFLKKYEWRSSSTLAELLQAVYRHCTKDCALSKLYESQNRSHTAAFCLLSLLMVVRKVELSTSQSTLTFKLSPLTQYCIASTPAEGFTIRHEDNDFLERDQFYSVKNDHVLFTKTPLTPNKNCPPNCFLSAVDALQKASEKDFYALCAQSLLRISSMDDAMASDYVETMSEMASTLKIQLPEEARFLLTSLLDHYLSIVADWVKPLEPSKRYYYNIRGVGHFCQPEKVPGFFRSEGNFASAVCAQFTPIEPTSHDGNCGVEAILMALKGTDAYRSTDPSSQGRLHQDIREFRKNIVEYARKHKEELLQEFSLKEVDRLLREYAAESADEHTTDLALACASRFYRRPIVVYSRTLDTFVTDAEARLIPSGVFSFEAGVKEEERILLVFWDHAHYALLTKVAR